MSVEKFQKPKTKINEEHEWVFKVHEKEIGVDSQINFKWGSELNGDKFDVCVTVHLWYNSINNQLDATITIYW